MVVDVDEAGRDHQTRGVDGARGGLACEPSHRCDPARLDAHIADVNDGFPVPSTTLPPRIKQVEILRMGGRGDAEKAKSERKAMGDLLKESEGLRL